MKNIILSMTLCFAIVSMAGFGLSEDELKIVKITDKMGEVPSDAAIEEVIVDFLKLRNPFLSQLPKPEIIKTPIEHPIQRNDNTRDTKPMPVMHQMPKVNEKPVELPRITLQGIVFGVKDPQVIVDEQSYGIGDHVMGATIRSISKHGVKLLFSGKEFDVDLEK